MGSVVGEVIALLSVVAALLGLAVAALWRRCAAAERERREKVRFRDDSGQLRLIVLRRDITHIAAVQNYVNVFFRTDGKDGHYLLRQSMTGLAELCEAHGLVRCHRSYYVNPMHVRAVHKDCSGLITAEMDTGPGVVVKVAKGGYLLLMDRLGSEAV